MGETLDTTDTVNSGNWQLVVDAVEFDSLQHEWEKLFRGNPEHSPFLSWGWVRSWLNHRAGAHDLRILVCRDTHNEILLILPLISKSRAGFFGVERLEIVCSHGSEASDHLGCLRRVELDSSMAELAMQGLQHFFGDRYRLTLPFADNKNEFPSKLEALARADGRATRLYPDAVCPTMALSESWDEFLLGLSSNFRSQVRRHYKRIVTTEGLSFNSVAPSEADAFLRTLVQLNRDRIKHKGQTSSLENDSTRDFVLESLIYMAEQGIAWMDTIEDGADVVACALHFVHGRTVYYYMGGFEERATHLRPGTALFAFVIQRSIEEKFESFDFLRGDDHYKYRWGAKDRQTTRIEIYPRRLLSGQLRCAFDGIELKFRNRFRTVWNLLRRPREIGRAIRQ